MIVYIQQRISNVYDVIMPVVRKNRRFCGNRFTGPVTVSASVTSPVRVALGSATADIPGVIEGVAKSASSKKVSKHL